MRTEPLTDRLTIARVLRVAAGQLDGRPKCKGALARDANGNAVNSVSNGAKCWCVLGAINVAAPSLLVTQDAILFLKTALGLVDVVGWFEDPRTSVSHAVEQLRRAADKAEGK